MVILHSPRSLDYASAGHPESPERVRSAVAQLQKGFHTWLLPEPCTNEDILHVHTQELLKAVLLGTFDDADTPVFPEIFNLAKLSAGAAIGAAEQALAGQPAFSLMRPPGHHAERNRVMGFCYFNNIAIAVARALSSPFSLQRVAILDFDCHHGNGTEDIFRGDERVLFVSLHQSPCYPGTGLTSQDNCLNYPLPPGTQPKQFLSTLDEGLNRIRDFKPGLLAVSAGFDAYKDDPITHLDLEIETFRDIGLRIAHITQSTGSAPALPCFAVLEGGYSREFAHCVEAFVNGWERH
jgi:acetoin utilization deacetylase AcuC-like enzyme